MKHLKLSTKFILFALWLFGALFRFYNLNWDNGYHLHPDERAIVMAVVKLQYPTSLSSFLSVTSPWNTHFFAYGSFPFYLLKIVGDGLGATFNPLFSGYDLITIAGRFLSAMFDLSTILLVFYLGKKLYGTTVGFMAAFFYSISVLPIQLSHFYAVDTLLTFFILATLYQLVLFYEHPTIRRSLLVGIFFGLALATKVSAIVLLVSIGTALAIDFVLLFLKHPHKPRVWLPHLPAFIKHLLVYAFTIGITTIVVYFICDPYAFLDFKEFWVQTLQQSEMTHNAFIFPYTLQYVGKIPYLYEAKNIFFWGMGPLLATFAFIGAIQFTYMAFYKEKQGKWAKEVILVSFFWVYFFVVGKFAVGFMRYMLPVYPLLALFAAVLAYLLIEYFQLRYRYKLIVFAYVALLLLIWPISFSRIYAKQNTRTTATEWISKNIRPGKTLAIEHWDDALPLGGAQNYHMLTLALYDSDTDSKWEEINQELKQSDYIIIASNRLYVPLQKLTNCARLPIYKCYQRTAFYYQQLFAGKLGFTKVAEFTDYPSLPFFDIPINDQSADESFTVYDHPKVMIFQKTAEL
jgi:hypothetical protein